MNSPNLCIKKWRWVLVLAANIGASVIGLADNSTQHTPFPIGMNLSVFSYGTSELPFKDLIFQISGPSLNIPYTNTPCPQQTPRDATGWFTSIPAACCEHFWAPLGVQSPYWNGIKMPIYPAGHYVFLYDGKATINFGWDAQNIVRVEPGRIEFDMIFRSGSNVTNGVDVTITDMDPAHPVTNVHMVSAQDEATFQSQPFSETFLDRLRPFKEIRFMDWSSASKFNQAPAFDVVSFTSMTITLAQNASDQDNAYTGMVMMINGYYPRIFITGYVGATRTLTLADALDVTKLLPQPGVIIFQFPETHWANRTPVGPLFQQRQSSISWEYMIQLCNTLKEDPWINVPTAADDDYISHLAQLFKLELDPSLTLHFEYSNEVWNSSYPGYNYAEAEVRELNLPWAGLATFVDAWEPYRFTQICKIFNQVYGEPDLRADRQASGKKSRLDRVISSQTAYVARATALLDWGKGLANEPTDGHAASDFADSFGMTFYWDFSNTPCTWSSSLDDLDTCQMQNIDQLTAPTNAKSNNYERAMVVAANARGLKAQMYEGGTSIFPANDPVQIQKNIDLSRSPRMYDVYTHALQAWQAMVDEFGPDKVGIFNQYHLVGQPSYYGTWGALESIYQDPSGINSIPAPKYRALADYANGFSTGPGTTPNPSPTSTLNGDNFIWKRDVASAYRGTTIDFTVTLSQAERVTIDVLNRNGAFMANMVDQDMSTGSHDFSWSPRLVNSKPLSSGVYILRLKTAGKPALKRFAIVN